MPNNGVAQPPSVAVTCLQTGTIAAQTDDYFFERTDLAAVPLGQSTTDGCRDG